MITGGGGGMGCGAEPESIYKGMTHRRGLHLVANKKARLLSNMWRIPTSLHTGVSGRGGGENTVKQHF